MVVCIVIPLLFPFLSRPFYVDVRMRDYKNCPDINIFPLTSGVAPLYNVVAVVRLLLFHFDGFVFVLGFASSVATDGVSVIVGAGFGACAAGVPSTLTVAIF